MRVRSIVTALLALLTLAAAGPACSHKQKLTRDDGVTSGPQTVAVWAEWIKNKSDKFDLRLNLKNETERNVIVLLGDLHCFRGGVRGTLKHTFFNTGERTIDFKPGEHKDFNAVCNLGREVQGDIKITVRRVYDNPGGDGATRGKVLAENIDWTWPKPESK